MWLCSEHPLPDDEWCGYLLVDISLSRKSLVLTLLRCGPEHPLPDDEWGGSLDISLSRKSLLFTLLRCCPEHPLPRRWVGCLSSSLLSLFRVLFVTKIFSNFYCDLNLTILRLGSAIFGHYLWVGRALCSLCSDVALNIHFQTMSGVALFHGCNPGLIKMLGTHGDQSATIIILYSRQHKYYH